MKWRASGTQMDTQPARGVYAPFRAISVVFEAFLGTKTSTKTLIWMNSPLWFTSKEFTRPILSRPHPRFVIGRNFNGFFEKRNFGRFWWKINR